LKIKKFILKWLWLVPLLIWMTLTVQASLSDETKELVDNLNMKHYEYGTLYASGDVLTVNPFDYWSYTINFEEDTGRFVIETSNGKWYIEMKKEEQE